MILLRGWKQINPLFRQHSNKSRSKVISSTATYLFRERSHRGGTSPQYQHKSFYHKTSTHFHDYRDDKEIENNHKLFEEQLLELEEERTSVFGKNEEVENDTNPLASIDRNNVHSLGKSDLNWEERVDDMNMDRESLYGFTQEEKKSWVNVAEKSKTYSASFLEAVEKGRKARGVLESEHEHNRDSSLEKGAKNNKDGQNDIIQQNTSQHFTHLSPAGDKIAMVDVGKKEVTSRVAMARSAVVFPQEVMEAFGLKDWQGKNKGSLSKEEIIGPKGPIFATAQLAGIMGAKRTSDLIPLCHPLTLDKVHVDIKLVGNRAIVECECRVTHKTGVEMEALVGASVAALTIYDMVKAISHNVRIEGTELVSKAGGKRDIGYNNNI